MDCHAPVSFVCPGPTQPSAYSNAPLAPADLAIQMQNEEQINPQSMEEMEMGNEVQGERLAASEFAASEAAAVETSGLSNYPKISNH